MSKEKTIANDIRAKIFAPYVLSVMYYPNNNISIYPSVYALTYGNLTDIMQFKNLNSYIEVTPLSKITDEDANHIAGLTGYPYLIEVGAFELCREQRFGLIGCLKVTQYLQSKGYALPYMDYSVADLVKLGVYKLK